MIGLELGITRRGGAAASPESVVWVITGGANGLTASGGTLIGTNGLSWNCVATPSKQLLSGDGYIEATLPATEATRGEAMLGFHTGDPALLGSTLYYQIKYAMLPQSNGNIQIYNSASLMGTPSTWTAGDLLRVAVVGTEVKYYKNGSVVFTDAQPVSYPLWGMGSFYNGVSGTNAHTQLASAVISGNWA